MDEPVIRPISSILGQCPDCQGVVRLPTTARPDLMVRCPHCSSSFSMQKILLQIPELEIIPTESKDPVVPVIDRVLFDGNPDEKKKFVVPPQLSKGAKRRRKRSRRNEMPDDQIPELLKDSFSRESYAISTDMDEESSESLDPNIPLTPDPEIRSGRNFIRVHSSQRHRVRKKVSRNSNIEAFKVVIGGLLAFPIAYLIIMWVFGQDPLGLGKSVGKVVPFAFPESFRISSESKKEKETKMKNRNSDWSSAESGNRSEDEAASEMDPRSESSDLKVPSQNTKSTINQIPDVAPNDDKDNS